MSSKITYREGLANAMSEAMEKSNTVIIGQGVNDFKGIFGTVLGLAEKYPDRVIETPIAEDSVAGICLGMSLNGMYPINTHIRSDFGLLLFNQLINLAAKYKYMFGGLFEVPCLFRMVVGRSWGQGAQHSQSLQSLLAHIPGLVVIMPSSPDSVMDSYRYAISHHKGPVISLEHRLMYELSFDDEWESLSNPFSSRIIQKGNDITVIATSAMVLEVKRASNYLKTYGINIEIIDLHSISHPDKDLILNSVKKTRRLIIADTSWPAYGVASEINRIVNENDPTILLSHTISLGMQEAPCPTAKSLEDIYYPDVHEIVKSVFASLNQKYDINSLPKKQSMTDFHKHFKGPF